MVVKQRFDLDSQPLEKMVHPVPLSYGSPANLKCDWEVIILRKCVFALAKQQSMVGRSFSSKQTQVQIWLLSFTVAT